MILLIIHIYHGIKKVNNICYFIQNQIKETSKINPFYSCCGNEMLSIENEKNI